MQIDVTLFELCTAGKDVGVQFRFKVVQSINVVRKENYEL